MSALVPVRLAVVGSTRFDGGTAYLEADQLVTAAYRQLRRQVETAGGRVVSGGAEGIDTMARKRAETDEFGWTVENGHFVEHLPANPRWEPDGYRARNERIARDCTHLLRIYRPDSATYGSGWTADRAEALGKVVRRYVWDPAAGRFVRVEREVRAS